MENQNDSLRKSGIPFVADLPWGAHICGFHETKEDLLNIVIPYFKAGLENNEYCIWTIPESLSMEEATNALKNSIPDFDFYELQLEIIPDTDWYFKHDGFQANKVIEEWFNKVSDALNRGYAGIRLCGSTAWLNKRYWKNFIEYEAQIEKQLANSKIIALCPYRLGQCTVHEILDVVHTHQFAFIKSTFDWKYSDYVVKFNRMNLIGKMASSFAHEIRNPITAVRGFIQLMQGKAELQNYNKYFSLMLEELDRTNEIIDEYLSLARDKKKNIESCNLNRILTGILPLLQAEAVQGSKSIILNTSNINNIMVDPKDIRQVILNLSRNSLEAMSEGDTLTINTFMANKEVILEINDSGHGMPQEILNKLGTPFLTTKDSGTGLGLFVCYQILEGYKAKVDVSSSKEGTRFTISFPNA